MDNVLRYLKAVAGEENRSRKSQAAGRAKRTSFKSTEEEKSDEKVIDVVLPSKRKDLSEREDLQ